MALLLCEDHTQCKAACRLFELSEVSVAAWGTGQGLLSMSISFHCIERVP